MSTFKIETNGTTNTFETKHEALRFVATDVFGFVESELPTGLLVVGCDLVGDEPVLESIEWILDRAAKAGFEPKPFTGDSRGTLRVYENGELASVTAL